MAGLPITRLPGGENSPESVLEQRTKEGQQRLQQEFQSEWDGLNQQANRLDQRKYQQLSGELQNKYKRKASELNQKTQMSISNLKELDRLAKSGAIADATEAKWRITLGPEAERAMFPKAKTQGSPMQQFGELDVYRNRLESNAKDFRILPSGKIPSFWRPKRYEKTAPEELQVFDRSMPAYDKKGMKEGAQQGAWRKASLEETQQYGLLSNELKRVTAEQNAIINPERTSSLMRTAATSPRIGGAISDQAKAYLDQRSGAGQQQQPANNDPLGLR